MFGEIEREHPGGNWPKRPTIQGTSKENVVEMWWEAISRFVLGPIIIAILDILADLKRREQCVTQIGRDHLRTAMLKYLVDHFLVHLKHRDNAPGLSQKSQWSRLHFSRTWEMQIVQPQQRWDVRESNECENRLPVDSFSVQRSADQFYSERE